MKTIAELLIENEIIKTNFENPFRGTSGILLPIYGDCREANSIVDLREKIVEKFIEKIGTESLECDAIAGTATGGISWAAFVAQTLRKPLLYVRPQKKAHGMGKMVEGRGEKNSRILLVEDMFSTAGSAVVSARALRSELNSKVENVIAIFSWDLPKIAENSKNENLNFSPLASFAEISAALLKMGKISETEFEKLQSWNADPENFAI
jgi:orotate phosphoribosyltransferase